jgi:hypothetical protein
MKGCTYQASSPADHRMSIQNSRGAPCAVARPTEASHASFWGKGWSCGRSMAPLLARRPAPDHKMNAQVSGTLIM